MNRTITLLVITAMFWLNKGLSQPFAWAKTAKDSGARNCKAMAIDEERNLYMVGSLNGEAGFDGKDINGNGSFLVKYSSAGSVIWVMNLNGLNCTGISADNTGKVSVTGSFSGKVQLGKFSFESVGGIDLFLIKLDSSGNILWARQGGGLGNDIAYALANDFYGNTIIVGSFEENMDLDSQTNLLSLGKGDAFLAMYDSNGVVQWAQKEGGDGDDAATSVAVDLGGNIFIAGRFSNTVDFYRSEATSKGGYDVFITKYNKYGLRLGVQVAGGPGDDLLSAIALDGSSNIFVTGTFTGSASFGSKTITSVKKDGFLAFYNERMIPKWVTSFGGPNDDVATAIATDGQSNVLVTGVFSGTANFGGQTLKCGGMNDIFIAKYDEGGRLLWAKDIGGDKSDSTSSICIDHSDTAYIAGNLQGKSNFGNIELDAVGTSSFFFAKMNPDPTLDIKPTPNISPNIIVFPNPSSGIFYLTASDNESLVDEYTVYNTRGQIVKDLKPIKNLPAFPVDLSDQPLGIYCLRATTNKGCFMEKLIRQ